MSKVNEETLTIHAIHAQRISGETWCGAPTDCSTILIKDITCQACLRKLKRYVEIEKPDLHTHNLTLSTVKTRLRQLRLRQLDSLAEGKENDT